MTSNSPGAVIKLPRHVYSRNSGASVSNDGKIPGFCFIKFDNKWANSKQRSQSPNSWGWPLFLQSQNFYSPRRGYLSPGNSIVLGIATTLLFISVTIFCRFWRSFCWNSRTLPTALFIFVTYALLTVHYNKNPPLSYFNKRMQIC